MMYVLITKFSSVPYVKYEGTIILVSSTFWWVVVWGQWHSRLCISLFICSVLKTVLGLATLQFVLCSWAWIVQRCKMGSVIYKNVCMWYPYSRRL